MQARTLYQEALALRRELGEKSGIAWSLRDLGELARAQGEYMQARTLLQSALTLWWELGDKARIALCFTGLGQLLAVQGHWDSVAYMYGAEHTILETSRGALPTEWKAVHEQTLQGARDALGEARFTATWEAGRIVPLEAAVVLALEIDPAQSAGERAAFHEIADRQAVDVSSAPSV